MKIETKKSYYFGWQTTVRDDDGVILAKSKKKKDAIKEAERMIEKIRNGSARLACSGTKWISEIVF